MCKKTVEKKFSMFPSFLPSPVVFDLDLPLQKHRKAKRRAEGDICPQLGKNKCKMP